MIGIMGNPVFGSKATSGLCQVLIAMMPPHSVYLETHLGGGAIMQRKPPALRNLGIEIDARVLNAFDCDYPVERVLGCCHDYLAGFPFDGSELVYSDPPYLHETRKSNRRYRYDYEDADHEALLSLLKTLPCSVMVSGYPSALYDDQLDGWGSVSVQVMNHAGVVTEKVWFNFEPDRVHWASSGGTQFHPSPVGQTQGRQLGPALPGDAAGRTPRGPGCAHGGGGGIMKSLGTHLRRIREHFAQLPDKRRGSNTQYAIEDIAMVALSGFFMQSPSFLAHQRTLAEQQGRSHAHTLFGLDRIPCDHPLREMLDGIPPESFNEHFHDLIAEVHQDGGLEPMRRLKDRLLIALDGTETFCSRKIHCRNCSTRKRSDDATEFFHQMVAATVVAPGQAQTLPLPPAFIAPQDGHLKQDCEREAAKRWLKHHGPRWATLNPVYLGDDLYACQSIGQAVLDQGGDFLFTGKPGSHQTLYEYLDGIELPAHEISSGRGAKRRLHPYR